MRCLDRNKTVFYYALHIGCEAILDEDGNESGEYKTVYSEPVRMQANISPASGSTQAEQFGTSIPYDKVIVTDDLSCPIDEHSVLFIDNISEVMLCDEHGVPIFTEVNMPIQLESGAYGVRFDYIVKKVARSLNSISYAIRRVDVS